MRQKFCLLLVFLMVINLLCGCSDLVDAPLDILDSLLSIGASDTDEDEDERPSKTDSTNRPSLNLPGLFPSTSDDAPATAPAETQPVINDNPYLDYYVSSGYLMPESDSRYYFRTELTQTDRDWLVLAKNEIYARHGYVFSDTDLAEYFNATSWYSPSSNRDPSGQFNKYEAHNVMLLGMLQDILDGKKITLSGNNPYLQYYNAETEFILTRSDKDVVERYHLRGFSKEELKLARNEIFARHGYYFSTENLLTYFALCSWYYPNPDITTTSKASLGSQEKKNVSTIQSYEKNPDFDATDLDTRLTYTIEADVFAVSVPEYWKQTADYYYSGDLVDFVQTASMYEYGGLMFGFMSVETLEEMDDYPSWFPVGTVTKAGYQSYYIVVVEPTDVQFDTEDAYIAGQYRYMYNEMDRVIATLRGANGYSFTPW